MKLEAKLRERAELERKWAKTQHTEVTRAAHQYAAVVLDEIIAEVEADG